MDKLSSHQTNGHLTHQIEEDRTSEHLAHQIEDRTQRLREEGERQEENESEREGILKDLVSVLFQKLRILLGQLVACLVIYQYQSNLSVLWM